jgi:hypothetical protein
MPFLILKDAYFGRCTILIVYFPPSKIINMGAMKATQPLLENEEIGTDMKQFERNESVFFGGIPSPLLLFVKVGFFHGLLLQIVGLTFGTLEILIRRIGPLTGSGPHYLLYRNIFIIDACISLLSLIGIAALITKRGDLYFRKEYNLGDQSVSVSVQVVITAYIFGIWCGSFLATFAVGVLFGFVWNYCMFAGCSFSVAFLFFLLLRYTYVLDMIDDGSSDEDQEQKSWMV